jgi:hypothetical protein
MNVRLTKETLLLACQMLQQWKWSYFLKGRVGEKVLPVGWIEGLDPCRKVWHKQKDQWRLGSNSLKATKRAWDPTRRWTLMSYHSQCSHMETSDPIRIQRTADLTRTLFSVAGNKTTETALIYVTWRFCIFLKALNVLVWWKLSLTVFVLNYVPTVSRNRAWSWPFTYIKCRGNEWWSYTSAPQMSSWRDA